MILDAALQFDTAVALTVSAASTNTIDLVALRDIGVGIETLEISVLIGTTFASAGATTLQIACEGSIDNATWTPMRQTNPLPKAVLVAGTKIPMQVPVIGPGQAKPRYLRLNYLVATGPFTGGTLSSMTSIAGHYSTGPDNRYAYPAGITVAN